MRASAIFLDRDGVINKVIFRDGKPCSPRKLDEFVFHDGIKEVVYKMKEFGYKVFVVSNQPDVARGEISQDVLNLMTEKMRLELPLDDIFICPHDDYHDCLCRKPKPGMLIEAAAKWGVDLGSSLLIGDTWKDVAAGRGAGCKVILIDAPYNQETDCDCRIRSLREVLESIIQPMTYSL